MCATSNFPSFRACAPVNAPRSCPNSSDSSSSAGSAAQFTATKGRSRRVPCRWIARAISSLPVPDSPVMRTVAVVSAIWRTSS